MKKVILALTAAFLFIAANAFAAAWVGTLADQDPDGPAYGNANQMGGYTFDLDVTGTLSALTEADIILNTNVWQPQAPQLFTYFPANIDPLPMAGTTAFATNGYYSRHSRHQHGACLSAQGLHGWSDHT